MQCLLAAEPVYQLQYYRGGRIGVENLAGGLPDHLLDDLYPDPHRRALMIRHHPEKLEIEYIELYLRRHPTLNVLLLPCRGYG